MPQVKRTCKWKACREPLSSIVAEGQHIFLCIFYEFRFSTGADPIAWRCSHHCFLWVGTQKALFCFELWFLMSST